MKPTTLRTPALCLGLLALAACGKGKDQGPPQMPPPEVGVITLQPQDAPLSKELVGRLSPFRSADVRARVAGVLLKRTYAEGSDVKQGQVLFQIDPAPLKAALDAAQGSLAQAEASYANARVNAQRARELAPKGYVSKADLDNALATERTAAAAVQQARASVQSARINLGYANVTSPIDGRAGQQQVTEGALVGQGEATLLTTVDQIDPLYVNFTLSAAELAQLRAAQTKGNVTLAPPDKTGVQIALPGGQAYPRPGTLDFSDTTVNPATGAVNLRAQVPNPDHTLLPGMYVTIKADLGEQHKVFLVPQQAVLRDTAGAYAMVVGADGKVARSDVVIGGTRGTDWVVTGGLKAGDRVVVSGLQKVKAGAPAKATPWQPGAGGASAQGPAAAGTK
ncbi:efflux RND transporter periplasmic adaptor subunit [Fulvimonas soli]|jgi:membrane fusion protein (multidrug efflux system)|uniref:Membrane fusion protein (Multidrug efflux system) n=1 Tax=Fulvimonas soli TaxID=155197 RepID=A0A316IQQ1_9GAMM|nr:efflux RND transporter periplasmic adaptor subunit [Fulvimonas soli]PWK92858.1 membrane fusion protein (multidrug efflux system) [Fulvimonas soli]TNY26500.1 efflux transporter periplasmic adaptor subunit [Fulvimonas soli]